MLLVTDPAGCHQDRDRIAMEQREASVGPHDSAVANRDSKLTHYISWWSTCTKVSITSLRSEAGGICNSLAAVEPRLNQAETMKREVTLLKARKGVSSQPGPQNGRQGPLSGALGFFANSQEEDVLAEARKRTSNTT